MGESPIRQRVDAPSLRQRFSAGGYWQRAQAGEFVQVVKRDSASRIATEPPGTRSQIVQSYDTAGQRIALVQYYLRPDGTLGGSGEPDPKMLLEGGVLSTIQP